MNIESVMTKRMLTVVLAVVGLCVAGCDKSSKDEKKGSAAKAESQKAKQKAAEKEKEQEKSGPLHAGMVTTTTSQAYMEVRDTLEGALSANSSHTILARVDLPRQLITHFGDKPEGDGDKSDEFGPQEEDKTDNADAGKQKPPAPGSLFILSQPNVEIPIIKAGQTSGLDLPQTLAVWKSGDNETTVAFNAPSYLTVRHGIEAAELILMRLGNGVEKVLSGAIGADLGDMPSSGDIGIEEGAGIKSVRAYQGTSETAERLVKVVRQSEDFKLVERVNHTANAKSLDQSVRPIQTVYVIHRKFGPALYDAAQSVALDYPFRLSALEDADGVVKVAYTSPEYLAKRHGIEDDELVSDAEDALSDLADDAAQGGEDE